MWRGREWCQFGARASIFFESSDKTVPSFVPTPCIEVVRMVASAIAALSTKSLITGQQSATVNNQCA